MSILFTPFRLGNIELKNRFVLSACEDNLASAEGMITESLLNKYAALVKGEVGLIISGHISVFAAARTHKYQLGIHDDSMVAGLKELAESVHHLDGRIIFQLGHSGAQIDGAAGQSVIDAYAVNQMSPESIREVVEAFRSAAWRALDAGADGVQLHAAHGYLISQFLSPFFNRRQDSYGSSDSNRFRLLKEIVTAIQDVSCDRLPLLVKLNSNDFTRTEGITPPIAATYAGYLADLKIDGLEVSSGTSSLSPWNLVRGEIPINEVLQFLQLSDGPQRSKVERILQNMAPSVKLEEGYNLEAARMIRPVMGGIPLFAVGGWRNVPAMEEALAKGYTDLIPMCRPFIREPNLAHKIRLGRTRSSSCTSCNRCFIAVGFDIPVRCYRKGLPQHPAPH